MSEIMVEKRKSERVQVFWLEDDLHHMPEAIFVRRPDDDAAQSGLLFDLSEYGVRVMLSFENETPPREFTMRIESPAASGSDPGWLFAQQMWTRKSSAMCYELGCQFIGMTAEQKDALKRLVGYFKANKSSEMVFCSVKPG
ncbi:MAG: hypothetical protein BWZ10_01661 [candidate division BRC1 bacterium ADurb.BinA364]|nr:MAG: hypothetical protein BWZ10_01661 [candidate division BRC1 bacterium ADurb.BinA364]